MWCDEIGVAIDSTHIEVNCLVREDPESFHETSTGLGSSDTKFGVWDAGSPDTSANAAEIGELSISEDREPLVCPNSSG